MNSERAAGAAKTENPLSTAATFRETLIFALAFTLLIALVEIPLKSKLTEIRDWFSWPFLLYTAFLSVGNIFAAMMSMFLIKDKLPDIFMNWPGFFFGFLGAFAFKGVLSNTNITLFDQDVLTIQDWITKALDYAVGAAVAKQVRRSRHVEDEVARALLKLPDDELNTYIVKYLGEEALTSIEASAQKHGANAKFYKTLELVSKAPDKSAAIAHVLRRTAR